MDEETVQNFIFKALLWGIAYYFIRRILNPDVDPDQFKSDAMYGTLAALVAAIMFYYLNYFIIPRL